MVLPPERRRWLPAPAFSITLHRASRTLYRHTQVMSGDDQDNSHSRDCVSHSSGSQVGSLPPSPLGRVSTRRSLNTWREDLHLARSLPRLAHTVTGSGARSASASSVQFGELVSLRALEAVNCEAGAHACRAADSMR